MDMRGVFRMDWRMKRGRGLDQRSADPKRIYPAGAGKMVIFQYFQENQHIVIFLDILHIFLYNKKL
jgi:hypothetical protein